jgi:hypothetical protein
MRFSVAALVLAATLLATAAVDASADVDYGPISHKGFKTVGAASTSLKLGLQIGFVANQSGLQSAVKAASNPASSSYGKYPSLSTLQNNTAPRPRNARRSSTRSSPTGSLRRSTSPTCA